MSISNILNRNNEIIITDEMRANALAVAKEYDQTIHISTNVNVTPRLEMRLLKELKDSKVYTDFVTAFKDANPTSSLEGANGEKLNNLIAEEAQKAGIGYIPELFNPPILVQST